MKSPRCLGLLLILPALVACGDCRGQDPGPSPLATGTSSSPSVSASAALPSRDCTSICNDYWMFRYREYRLCGGGSDLKDPRWSTRACWRARTEATSSRSQVDVQEEGRADDAGALCRCGPNALPFEPKEREQVTTKSCDSLCESAEGLFSRIESTCRFEPWDKEYDDPKCYEMEQRFYKLRPQIFDCWCTTVSFTQRLERGMLRDSKRLDRGP